MKNETLTRDHARNLDRQDPLRDVRDRFYIPDHTIYLDGNSLGLLSRDAEQALMKVVNEWKQGGIHGWFDAGPPWLEFGERLGAMAAGMMGAEPGSVVATGTTTVNIHSLVSTFYHPRGIRRKILADSLNFPTDLYALQSQIRLRGGDPDRDLVLIPPRDGRFLDEDDLIQAMQPDVALVFLPSVLYRSGQLLDMERLTREARARGIPIGFDCSHSAGAVPHRFGQWGVDFAVWCSYKYLNGGPGSTAFLYVNPRHFLREPGMAGWFGYLKEKQFDMLTHFEHEKSARGWQISSSGILAAASLFGSLEIIDAVSPEAIRRKSLALTGYLMDLIENELAEPPYDFAVGTPRPPERRGGHVALERKKDARQVSEALIQRKIVVDYRRPDVIRMAPVALYNTFEDVWLAVQALKEIVDQNEMQNRGYCP